MPNWDEIRKEFESTKITLAALAEKHGIKLGTLKSRKSREGWSRGSPKKDATKQPKKDASIKKVATLKSDEVNNKTDQFEPVVESDELTDKQRLFCMYYVKYWNAGKAAKKAGYECSYPNGFYEIGSQLLKKTQVKIKIDESKRNIAENTSLETMAVLQKYIDIAFADITDFVEFGQKEMPELDHNGDPMVDEYGEEITYAYSFVHLKNHEEVDGSLITEVKKGKDGVSVKLADKMRALEFLSKYTDLLSDNDKKRLQEEKLKTDIAKTKAEVERISQGIPEKVVVTIVDDIEEEDV
jgi:phage terminase small subunit